MLNMAGIIKCRLSRLFLMSVTGTHTHDVVQLQVVAIVTFN